MARNMPFSRYWDEVNDALRRAGAATAKRGEAEMLHEVGHPPADAASVIIDQRKHDAAEDERADEVYFEGRGGHG